MSKHCVLIFFLCVCYNIVITHDFLCCRKSHALREREREKKEKISMNFAEEKKKFPYYHHSELVMYSVITHVLSNNVKSTQRQASAKWSLIQESHKELKLWKDDTVSINNCLKISQYMEVKWHHAMWKKLFRKVFSTLSFLFRLIKLVEF